MHVFNCSPGDVEVFRNLSPHFLFATDERNQQAVNTGDETTKTSSIHCSGTKCTFGATRAQQLHSRCNIPIVKHRQTLLLLVVPIMFFLQVILISQPTSSGGPAWKVTGYFVPFHVRSSEFQKFVAIGITPLPRWSLARMTRFLGARRSSSLDAGSRYG